MNLIYFQIFYLLYNIYIYILLFYIKNNINLNISNILGFYLINSNEYIHDSYDATNLKIEMSKFSYENQKQEILSKSLRDYFSKFIIWNESPDKQNMIGELFVYIKKE